MKIKSLYPNLFSEYLLPVIFFISLFCHHAEIYSQTIIEEPLIKVEFSKKKMQRHLKYLGSDLFEGRGTGTKGGELAAKYIAIELSENELIPIGENNTFYQNVPMHGSTPSSNTKLTIYSNGSKTPLILGKDYLIFNSAEQTFVSDPVPLVFSGLGIIAPEFDYNDYLHINTENKISVYLEGEPQSEDSAYFNGGIPTVYSLPEAKKRTAVSRGALGSILLLSEEKNDWEKLVNSYSFEHVTLGYTTSKSLSFIFHSKVSSLLFSQAPYDYSETITKSKSGNLNSFDLNTELSFKGEFNRRDFLAQNVIGFLEGSDSELKDSYLIVSAHYDHLGIGPAIRGDSIYNGVLDNAIGVAGVLELSRIFSSLKTPPKRSIIFVLLTGEEKGLLGSRYYTYHPVVPLYKTICNINVDGLAVYDEFNSVIGIGEEFSTLKINFESAVKKNHFEIPQLTSEYLNNEMFYRSDQIAFAQAGIPSMLVLDAPDSRNSESSQTFEKHKVYIEEMYHSPFDDLNQVINLDTAIQHLNLIFDLIYEIANSSEEPKWYNNSPYRNARLQSIAEQR